MAKEKNVVNKENQIAHIPHGCNSACGSLDAEQMQQGTNVHASLDRQPDFGTRVYNRAAAVTISEPERSLLHTALCDKVKDKLNQSSASLSGRLQQRLRVARAIAVEPGVIVLDEPSSSLDPACTLKIEDLMISLDHECIVVSVT